LLIGSDGVEPTRIVGVSACLLLSSLAPRSPKEAFFWHRLSRVVLENGRKTVVVVWWWLQYRAAGTYSANKKYSRQWQRVERLYGSGANIPTVLTISQLHAHPSCVQVADLQAADSLTQPARPV